MELRPFPDQQQLIELLQDSARRGNKRILAFSGTGSGKSEIVILLAQQAIAKGNRVAFVDNRIQRTTQFCQRLEKYGFLDYGVMQGENSRNLSAPLLVCSIDTVRSRGGVPDDIKIIFVDECFTPDTEILTENGWVKFADLSEEKVAQWSCNDGIAFVDPIEKIVRYHDGEMVRLWSDKLIDVTMTPNHELVVEHNGEIRKIKAKNMVSSNYNHMFTSSYGDSNHEADPRVELTPLERLAIAFQADGSYHTTRQDGSRTVSFSFVKSRKIERLFEICLDGGFRCHEVSDSKGDRRRFLVNVGHSLVSKYLSESMPKFENLSRTKAMAIINEMVEWDGSKVNKKGLYYYSSKYKGNCDYYQIVSVLAGLKARQTVQIDNRSKSFSDIYRLFIAKTNKFSTQKVKKETTKYTGNVYCVRVPSGNIIIKSKNGNTLVTGNCHYSANTSIYEQLFKDRFVIGLTGSPWAKLGRHVESLGGPLYQDLVYCKTMEELFASGRLLEPIVWSLEAPDMTGVKTVIRHGEKGYDEVEGAKRFAGLTGDVIENYLKYAPGKQALAFSFDIESSLRLRDAFLQSGIKAEHVDYHAKDTDRNELYDAFRAKQFQVLCNVELLGCGADFPMCSVVILNKAYKSKNALAQVVGRPLRVDPDDPNKEAIIIDHGKSLRTLGLPWEWPIELIDGKPKKSGSSKEEKPEPKEPFECPQCKRLRSKKSQPCPSCGHRIYLQEKEERQTGEAHRLGKKTQKVKISVQLHNMPKQLFYSQLIEYARAMGYKDGWAAVHFKKIHGDWPSGLKNVGCEIDPVVARWVRSEQIRWAHARRFKYEQV
jgi:superfamily II DNA or RNA helicase